MTKQIICVTKQICFTIKQICFMAKQPCSVTEKVKSGVDQGLSDAQLTAFEPFLTRFASKTDFSRPFAPQTINH